MADTRPNDGSANTAIVAIVVLILVAVVAFLVFFRDGGEMQPPEDGPDIELEVEPPAENGDTGGSDGGNGTNNAEEPSQ